MQEHVTLLGPQESPRAPGRTLFPLPQDLLEQIRGRVRCWPSS